MLRTDLFKTKDRAETRFFAVRDTLTQNEQKFDASHFDTTHCRRGSFGIGWQFLVLTNGDIQLGRDIETVGSHSRNYDTISVGIGVVGGVDEKGDRQDNRNQDQLEALEDLLEFLWSRYPYAELHDNPVS